MDMETEELLRKTLVLSEENNKILLKMQRQAQWARYYYILRWFILIAFTAGAYYYIRPYIDELIRVYDGLTEGVNLIFRSNMMK